MLDIVGWIVEYRELKAQQTSGQRMTRSAMERLAVLERLMTEPATEDGHAAHRRYARMPCAIDAEATPLCGTHGRSLKALVVNLGAGGAMLHMHIPEAPSAGFPLQLSIVEEGEVPVTFATAVRWARPSTEGYYVGVEFVAATELPDDARTPVWLKEVMPARPLDPLQSWARANARGADVVAMPMKAPAARTSRVSHVA